MDLHNGLERKQGSKNSHEVATPATSWSSQKYTLLDWTSALPVWHFWEAHLPSPLNTSKGSLVLFREWWWRAPEPPAWGGRLWTPGVQMLLKVTTITGEKETISWLLGTWLVYVPGWVILNFTNSVSWWRTTLCTFNVTHLVLFSQQWFLWDGTRTPGSIAIQGPRMVRLLRNSHELLYTIKPKLKRF